MNALAIGIISGLLIIGFLAMFRNLDRTIIYALILCAIGFLYVGFTWTELPTVIVCGLQAIVFLFLAYFGSRRPMLYLATGFLLHGIWDLLYTQFGSPNLLPPHYNLFCMAVDFVIGFYLILEVYRKKRLISS